MGRRARYQMSIKKNPIAIFLYDEEYYVVSIKDDVPRLEKIIKEETMAALKVILSSYDMID